jgi:hypothetical protein
MEKIVEAAISWQLEEMKDQKLGDDNTLSLESALKCNKSVNNKGEYNPESLLSIKQNLP